VCITITTLLFITTDSVVSSPFIAARAGVLSIKPMTYLKMVRACRLSAAMIGIVAISPGLK
jgi:hypothetical protein